MNWPVAGVVAPFLSSIGAPLIPHIRSIFATDDHMWKYWVMTQLITTDREVAEAFRGELERIAYSPTPDEREELLDEPALDVLAEYGWQRTI